MKLKFTTLMFLGVILMAATQYTSLTMECPDACENGNCTCVAERDTGNSNCGPVVESTWVTDGGKNMNFNRSTCSPEVEYTLECRE